MADSIPLQDREHTDERVMLMAIGRALRSMRTLYGLSQEELVRECAQAGPGFGHVTSDKVNKWETGRTAIRVPDLFELSSVLGPFWTWPVPMDDVEMTDAFRRVQGLFARRP